MYKTSNPDQMRIDDFFLPFGGKLNSENRWVKLGEAMPWDRIEAVYSEHMSDDTGRSAISSRIAFGACFIRESENLSDRGTVDAILENPYMQYFLGLKEFATEPLFDSSMMVHFRNRFPVNFVSQVNEYVCTGKWPDEPRDVDRNDHDDSSGDSSSELELPEPEETPHKGNLVMDATVAPADIRFPTDISLLNQCREVLEKAVDVLWPYVPHDHHKLPYNKRNARKSYLRLSKSKKWTKVKVHSAISDQLHYVQLAMERVNQFLAQDPELIKKLPRWIQDRLEVIPIVYLQQKEMFDNNKHTCENRIVSLEQPHVRPINRGKRPYPTEFGQKIHLSVVDGYVYLEQTSWENFNESTDLKKCIENYYHRFGYYPEAILADKIYQTKANKQLCKQLHIRLSGLPLGRRSQEQDQQVKEQMYKDSCERNIVEGRNGTLKRKYGLNRIMCKTNENSKTEMAFCILAMNAFRKIREHFLRYFWIAFCTEINPLTAT